MNKSMTKKAVFLALVAITGVSVYKYCIKKGDPLALLTGFNKLNKSLNGITSVL
jgi:hypothetical protein